MLQGKGIDCFATHPGLAATPLYPKLDKSKPEAVAVNLFEKVYPVLWYLHQGHSVLAGGRLCMMQPSCAGMPCTKHLECYSAGVLYVSCTLHVCCMCERMNPVTMLRMLLQCLSWYVGLPSVSRRWCNLYITCFHGP